MDRGPARGGTSIAITYPVVLCFVMGLVVLAMGILATAGMRRSTTDLLEQLTHQVTERMRLAVRDTLETPVRVSDMLVEGIRRGTIRIDDHDDLVELIPRAAALARAFPGIGSVGFVTARDDVMWVEAIPTGGWKAVTYDSARPGVAIEHRLDRFDRPMSPPMGEMPYDPAKRPWIQAAIAAGEQGGWSPLYTWATSDENPPVGSGFTRELRDDEGRLAIVDIGFTTSDISRQMARIQLGRKGRSMIIDAEGSIVASDEPSLLKSLDGRVLSAREIDDPILRRIADVLPSDPDEHAGVFRLRGPEGDWWEAEEEPLAMNGGPPWRLVLAIPEEDLLSGVTAVRNRMLLAGLLILASCGLVGYAIARTIVRPILALRGTAAAIAGGDLDARFSPSGGREFTDLSHDLASMTSGLRERFEMRNALEVAMEVQQNLLPTQAPSVEGLDVAGLSVYCDETGGDYFDFLEIDTAAAAGTTVALGDVTGHGIGAALIMANARAALHARIESDPGLGDLLASVNRALVDDIPLGRFMTLLLLRVDADRSRFDWASAGHDPPLVFDPVRDAFDEPDGGGVPLGIDENESFDAMSQPIPGPGSIILGATDGVWETVSPDGDFFGKDRLREVVRANHQRPAREIAEAVVRACNDFRGGDRPEDDVTLVVIKVE
ncbi:MAG: SpoIIE family protein phosphatase [Planctomycetota bacterium]|nr:SpoIIE family protein phosphatase [Planctomycetota bacterium]